MMTDVLLRIHLVLAAWALALHSAAWPTPLGLPSAKAQAVHAATQRPWIGATVLLHAATTPDTLRARLREHHAVGFRHLIFQVFEYQRHGQSVVIAPIPEKTAPQLVVERALQDARTLGFTVGLSPIVLLEAPKKTEWRGNLRPRDVRLWQQSYRDMIFKYARLAQASGVDIFFLGSELSSMEYQFDFWEALMSDVRQVFGGALSYAFNWDHLGEAKVWAKLDVLALSSYYELVSPHERLVSVSELIRRWRPIQERLHRWSTQLGRPLLFVEAGYPSHTHGLVFPWNEFAGHTPDPEPQRRGLEAFFSTWSDTPWVQGLSLYTFDSDTQDPKGYAIKGKAAENTVRRYLADALQGAWNEGVAAAPGVQTSSP